MSFPYRVMLALQQWPLLKACSSRLRRSIRKNAGCGYLFLASRCHPPRCRRRCTLAVPRRRSLAESPAWEQVVGYDVAVAARTSLEGAMLVNPELMGFEAALNAMVEAFSAVRIGDVTPETALMNAQEKSGY